LVWERRQSLPEAYRGALSHPGHQARQHGHPGQKNLPFDQASRDQVEYHRGSLGAQPGSGIDPPDQPEVLRLTGEVAIIVPKLNFAGVLAVRGFPVEVLAHAARIGYLWRVAWTNA